MTPAGVQQAHARSLEELAVRLEAERQGPDRATWSSERRVRIVAAPCFEPTMPVGKLLRCPWFGRVGSGTCFVIWRHRIVKLGSWEWVACN